MVHLNQCNYQRFNHSGKGKTVSLLLVYSEVYRYITPLSTGVWRYRVYGECIRRYDRVKGKLQVNCHGCI